MNAYAVIETGGKQYRVQANETLKIERLDAKAGDKVDLAPVLAVSDGTTLTIGTPTVANAKVTAAVVELVRGPKVISYKRKRRKGYERKIGHRQDLMAVKIESITA